MPVPIQKSARFRSLVQSVVGRCGKRDNAYTNSSSARKSQRALYAFSSSYGADGLRMRFAGLSPCGEAMQLSAARTGNDCREILTLSASARIHRHASDRRTLGVVAIRLGATEPRKRLFRSMPEALSRINPIAPCSPAKPSGSMTTFGSACRIIRTASRICALISISVGCRFWLPSIA